MKSYTITQTNAPITHVVKAHSELGAITKCMEKYYENWHGPKVVNGLYEIYNTLGMKLSLKIV